MADVLKFEVPGGHLYVRVISAEERECWVGERRVNLPVHRFEVSTSAAFTSERGRRGEIVLRGRAYSLLGHVESGPGVHYGPIWSGRIRNADGLMVGENTKARSTLKDLARGMTSTLDEEHPEWRTASWKIRLSWQEHSIRDRAADRRREATALEAKADALALEIAALKHKTAAFPEQGNRAATDS